MTTKLTARTFQNWILQSVELGHGVWLATVGMGDGHILSFVVSEEEASDLARRIGDPIKATVVLEVGHAT